LILALGVTFVKSEYFTDRSKGRAETASTLQADELAGRWAKAQSLSVYCSDGRHTETITSANGKISIADMGGTREFQVAAPDGEGWWTFDGAQWRREGDLLVQQAGGVRTEYLQCP
jgi:hypothetical protein